MIDVDPKEENRVDPYREPYPESDPQTEPYPESESESEPQQDNINIDESTKIYSGDATSIIPQTTVIPQIANIPYNYYVWPIIVVLTAIFYIYYNTSTKYLHPENSVKSKWSLDDFKKDLKQYIRNIGNKVQKWKDYVGSIRDKYIFNMYVDKDTVKTSKYKEEFTNFIDMFSK